jgi:predicted O-methyltransferase YrrM
MKPDEIAEKLADLPVYILGGDIIAYNIFMKKLSSGARALDLGTGWGKSALIMAMSNPDVTIDSIDTGVHQTNISVGWAANQDDYKKKLEEQFEKYGVKNIRFQVADVLTFPIVKDSYDLIHMDLPQVIEPEVFIRYLEALKSGGFFLIRNWANFRGTVDASLDKVDYFYYGGIIQVVKKK